jgi:hypothetical protein
MKKAVLIATLFLIGVSAISQSFDVDTLVYNGNTDKHINFVILGDGYTQNEISKFVTDATKFTNSFFSVTPYSKYEKFFNVFIIKVPSNQSGASHPGTAADEVNNIPPQPVITVNNLALLLTLMESIG